MGSDNIEGNDQVRSVGQHEPTIGGESTGIKPQLSRHRPTCVYVRECGRGAIDALFQEGRIAVALTF